MSINISVYVSVASPRFHVTNVSNKVERFSSFKEFCQYCLLGGQACFHRSYVWACFPWQNGERFASLENCYVWFALAEQYNQPIAGASLCPIGGYKFSLQPHMLCLAGELWQGFLHMICGIPPSNDFSGTENTLSILSEGHWNASFQRRFRQCRYLHQKAPSPNPFSPKLRQTHGCWNGRWCWVRGGSFQHVRTFRSPQPLLSEVQETFWNGNKSLLFWEETFWLALNFESHFSSTAAVKVDTYWHEGALEWLLKGSKSKRSVQVKTSDKVSSACRPT